MIDLSTRRSGVLLHPTSLPGPHGVGDLGAQAYRFVDWLQAAGQSLWQWLPINPIGPGDSPYQSVSAFAGSPLMVALEPLAEAGWLAIERVPTFDPTRVDFASVIPWRLQQLRAAAKGFFERAGADQHEAFAQWCRREAAWLDDYALFMALESAQQGRPWWEWPTEWKWRQPVALEDARREHREEIRFWCFVQWCFDRQATDLKGYANQRGLHLVGDLPIFIAHHSADCWSRPDLYQLDAQGQPTVIAGVPPDDPGPLGQRWGNPLYRWDRMAAEKHAWWAARVRRALAHVDVIRIDHFRGFAAYWEIPASSPTAAVGRWVPGPGRALFDDLQATLGELPIIAEDLGYITPDVIALRDTFKLPGMKILQFAFGGDGTHEFLPHNYPRHCVVYTGTHDNDTARGWWDHALEQERRFCAAYLGCQADSVAWQMLRAANLSVAAMAITPMQDLLGLPAEHRMNIPGTLGGSNWRWRVDPSALDPGLARRMAELAAISGR